MEKETNGTLDNKIIHKYQDYNIKVIIEIPVQNEERDTDLINDIKKIMNNRRAYDLFFKTWIRR